MFVEPDAILCRILLSVCNRHDLSGSSGIGENVKKMLLERESSNYVFVANICTKVELCIERLA